ncbi:uncharacterized protein BCR38DRAFT_114640 [Pseudomassariella vexata]|uniref:Secreted protein n=1 Tax=Pseudomassariella vexata TaxID=1141098 RepID=A0A1Y2DBE7_9PEZI|nr:uncharacterized protein BCR38DRAFT_114640 [Pseudomassariella vexata]ORY56591.1 hypothetical protein BCR38DRAFT_114640 [Pseudomassariella vexata]
MIMSQCCLVLVSVAVCSTTSECLDTWGLSIGSSWAPHRLVPYWPLLALPPDFFGSYKDGQHHLGLARPRVLLSRLECCSGCQIPWSEARPVSRMFASGPAADLRYGTARLFIACHCQRTHD